jgi:hypothetical protein
MQIDRIKPATRAPEAKPIAMDDGCNGVVLGGRSFTSTVPGRWLYVIAACNCRFVSHAETFFNINQIERLSQLGMFQYLGSWKQSRHLNPPGCKLLIMGLPGAGKTTLAQALAPMINAVHFNADEVRAHLNKDLGYSGADRVEQATRMGWLCDQIVKAGVVAIADFVCPTAETRAAFKAGGDAFVVWIDRIDRGRFDDAGRIRRAGFAYRIAAILGGADCRKAPFQSPAGEFRCRHQPVRFQKLAHLKSGTDAILAPALPGAREPAV